MVIQEYINLIKHIGKMIYSNDYYLSCTLKIIVIFHINVTIYKEFRRILRGKNEIY